MKEYENFTGTGRRRVSKNPTRGELRKRMAKCKEILLGDIAPFKRAAIEAELVEAVKALTSSMSAERWRDKGGVKLKRMGKEWWKP